ncbi:MAG: hypothetical protein IIC55_10475 [Proteobacteria bacterium]|nr:hypothetical protein [Pseudomonadota bacterium]
MTEKHDTLPGLFYEWDRLANIPESQRRAETEQQTEMRLGAARGFEKAMVKLVPKTTAGAVALTKLLQDFQTDDPAKRICDNLITGLEGMDGG